MNCVKNKIFGYYLYKLACFLQQSLFSFFNLLNLKNINTLLKLLQKKSYIFGNTQNIIHINIKLVVKNETNLFKQNI